MSNHLEHGNHNPYVQHTSTASSSAQPGKRDKMWDVLGRCGKMLEGYGKMAEEAAENVLHHIKVSPSITDAAKARFVQGTKVIAEGGSQRLFQHTFGVIPGEKYLHSYACYLADPSGPVNGMLYISTKRVAFCSESPLCYSSSPGQPQWVYYKHIGIDAIYSMSNPLDAKDNPYVQYSSASASPNGKYKMWEALDRCGKTFEDCSRMIEAVADSLWNHCQFFPQFKLVS